MHRSTILGVAVSFTLCAPSHGGFKAIALLGDSAPDTGGGSYGNLLGTASIDASGELTFWSTINGVPSSQSTGAFRTRQGVIERMVQEGGAAPGVPGETLRQIGGPNYSASGVVALPLRLNTSAQVTTSNDWGLWLDDGAGLTLVAREGDAAPGAGGALFDRPGEPILSPRGDLAFHAQFKIAGSVDSANDGSIWRKALGGPLEMVAREGDAAPGVDGGVFNYVDVPAVNSSGDLAFYAEVRSDASARGVDSTNDVGLWRTNGSALELVAREGDAAPGAEGFVFDYLRRPTIHSDGGLTFLSSIRSESDPRGLTSGSGLWTAGESGLEHIAHSGQAAPGSAGLEYDDFLWAAANDAGDIAYGAYMRDPDAPVSVDRGDSFPSGLWLRSGADASIAPIALTGDTAPGADGAEFAEFASPVMNQRGDVVFFAYLAIEGDVTFDNSSGVWAYVAPTAADAARGVLGEFMMIARKGDEFEVAPGDVRTIDYVDVQGSGVESFEPTPALNDSGLLALSLGFTDGSVGVFTFQVPAPGAGALLALAGAVAARRKR